MIVLRIVQNANIRKPLRNLRPCLGVKGKSRRKGKSCGAALSDPGNAVCVFRDFGYCTDGNGL